VGWLSIRDERLSHIRAVEKNLRDDDCACYMLVKAASPLSLSNGAGSHNGQSLIVGGDDDDDQS
jgi:hypothetical protein